MYIICRAACKVLPTPQPAKRRQTMVKMEITKVILTRSDEWALVSYRTSNDSGTCGGKFGCHNSLLVPGQYYSGKLQHKRTRSGQKKCSFVGVPVSRTAHALKAAFKKKGLTYTDRTALFSRFKPVETLIAVLQHRKHQELMSVPKIGRKKVERLYLAYQSVAQELSVSSKLAKALPSLHAYLNNNQRNAVMKWMENSSERFVQFVCRDPWRIVYDTEFDSFSANHQQRRLDFLAATTHKSRLRMTECACQDLNVDADHRRARCTAIHAVYEYMKKTGHYWMPLFKLTSVCGPVQPDWPIVTHDGHVALSKYADIERFLAQTFASTKEQYSQPGWQMPSEEAVLDLHQRNAVKMACTEPLFILCGGAGVGKTSVCKHIVDSLSGDITCAAPTGKAAQRLAASTGRPSSTVHRLVYGSDTLTGTLLLDEQSMQEPEILARLLQKHTFNKIIFVGDSGQLTSVGPGQFFRDICRSSMPQVELVHIYRSGPDSLIASNGQKIREGNTDLDTALESFVIEPYVSEDDIVNESKQIYQKTGIMPMVLCNTNAEICTLNKKLREICNPIGTQATSSPVCMDYVNNTWRYDNWRFGVGDSVINITNKYVEEDGETVLQVANGEVGTVVSAGGGRVAVRFDKVVWFDIMAENPLRPAYALTVNKAQGSEYTVVIVKASSAWGSKRERFYTAVTRAQQKCIVYEVGNAIDECIRAQPSRRKTYLMQRM